MDTQHIEQLHEELERAVERLGDDAMFASFLRGAATFHRYSWSNVMLIWIQRPDATAVKGFRAWQSLGRQVRKGEKGIRIQTPRPYTKTVERDGEDVEERRMGFGWASVFDVAQTDPIPGHPTPWTAPELPDVQGDPAVAAAVWDAVAAHLRGLGIAVMRCEASPWPSAHGWYSPARKEVSVVRAAPAREAMVLIHEAAHALVDAATAAEGCGDVDGYAANEVLAESVAYIVATAVGIEATACSATYVAVWLHRDAAGFRKSMTAAMRIASDLIAVVEGVAVAPSEMAA